ncbi:MAG: VWA domain-containing protein [Myxococcota bacterium]
MRLLPLVLFLAGCGSLHVRGEGPHFALQANGTLPALVAGAEAEGGVEVVEHGDPRGAEVVELDAEGELGGEVRVDGSGHGAVAAEGHGTSGHASGEAGHVGTTAGSSAVATSVARSTRATGDGRAGYDRAGESAAGESAAGESAAGAGTASIGSAGATSGTHANAGLDASGTVDASASIDGGISVGATGAGAAPRTTNAPGIMAISARGNPTRRVRPSLSLLMNGGLSVDGAVVRLSDIGPLSIAAADASSTVVADGSITVTAEVVDVDMIDGAGEADLVLRAAGGQAAAGRAPLSVHLVLDRSSSMQSSWQEVIRAAQTLIGELDAADSIQIVAYGSRGVEVLAPTRVGNGAASLAALANISVGGGTNIEAGLEIAYDAARRRPTGERTAVILVSDGVPTQGAFEGRALGGLALRARTSFRTSTTVVGLGHQFDAELLRTIAVQGRGGFHVSRDAASLAPTLRAELDQLELAAAVDVQVDVALPVGVELVEMRDPSGVAEHRRNGIAIRLPHISPGAERRVVARVRIAPDTAKVADVRVNYRTPGQPVRTGSRAVYAGSDSPRAHAIAIDAHLGATLDMAGTALQNGDKDVALAALDAHVAFVGEVETPALLHRTAAVARIGAAVDALFGRASHRERRELGQAMAALSFSFGR